MSLTREESIFLAKISEQSERFDDMLENMKKVVEAEQELSVDERNLLSVAYKNAVGTRRTSYRALNSIEQKEVAKDQKNLHLIDGFKKKVEKELQTLCQDIISLLDKFLIPKAKDEEAQVFYSKMKGDYYRYIAENANLEERKAVGDQALKSYEEATAIAKEKLEPTNPIRLGLSLNFSVFYYEVMNDPTFACTIAKQAFDDAIGEIDNIKEGQYKDSTTIMQLIRDNLTLWTSDINEAETHEAQPENP